uniref:Uncharacterized protein n=1 Tax=Panagrolaimus davidi TaxID=227884 RepID=A0A914P721_9BILA
MLIVYIYTRNYQNLSVCWSFGCLMTSAVQQIHIIYKLILSFVHLITAVLCFYILHKFNSNTATGNRSKVGESIVIFTIFAEILSDTLPHFLSFIVVNLLNINLNQYLGSYLRIAICLDGFLCSWKYSSSLRPLFNNPSKISKTEVSNSRISRVSHK